MRTRDVQPHPQNAPGDFFVEDNCCLSCGVPQAVAPDLFPVMDDRFEHCYVRRQPSSELELGQMLDAIRGAEVGCIHYRGRDPEILAKVKEIEDNHFMNPKPPTLGELWKAIRDLIWRR